MLHPRHKLEYFKRAGWEDDWISTARKIVHDEFERSYSDFELVEEEEDPLPTEVCISCLFRLMNVLTLWDSD